LGFAILLVCATAESMSCLAAAMLEVITCQIRLPSTV
jgi:hypothetical protein